MGQVRFLSSPHPDSTFFALCSRLKGYRRACPPSGACGGVDRDWPCTALSEATATDFRSTFWSVAMAKELEEDPRIDDEDSGMLAMPLSRMAWRDRSHCVYPAKDPAFCRSAHSALSGLGHQAVVTFRCACSARHVLSCRAASVMATRNRT